MGKFGGILSTPSHPIINLAKPRCEIMESMVEIKKTVYTCKQAITTTQNLHHDVASTCIEMQIELHHDEKISTSR